MMLFHDADFSRGKEMCTIFVCPDNSPRMRLGAASGIDHKAPWTRYARALVDPT